MNREAVHSYVSQASTQARLTAYVRRRGVREDPEDVVQQVVCDVLAVQAVPGEPDEIPRWVNTIARRRVADWFRRQRPRAELPELVTRSDPSARDMLRRVDAGLNSDAERVTLSWLLREYAGESLKDIARELSMDAATLRQRVCRLRRQLRVRYLGAALMLLLGVVGGWRWLALEAPALPATSSMFTSYDGTWRIVSSSLATTGDWPLSVVVQGDQARLEGLAGRWLGTLRVEQLGPNQLLVRSVDQHSYVELKRLSNARVQLSTAQGTMVLERVSDSAQR